MSHTFTCDWCGEDVGVREYVQLTAEASKKRTGWSSGWVAHYHGECFESIRDMLDLLRETGSDLAGLPVTESTSDADEDRSIADYVERVNAGTVPEYFNRRMSRALERAGLLTLEEISEWTEAEIAELEGIGPGTIYSLRQQLAAIGLAFTAPGRRNLHAGGEVEA